MTKGNLLGLVALALSSSAKTGTAYEYDKVNVQGWEVRVAKEYWSKNPVLVPKILKVIDSQLLIVKKVVPTDKIAKLRAVKIYVHAQYPKFGSKAEYHPSREWLAQNGRDPEMAKSIEITMKANIERETARMPCWLLHELCHAYHDQVLGFGNAEVIEAYRLAKASGVYDRVQIRNYPGEKNSFGPAYALQNEREYFAESCEAYFFQNDIFPFNRDQLLVNDPRTFALMEKVWATKISEVS